MKLTTLFTLMASLLVFASANGRDVEYAAKNSFCIYADNQIHRILEELPAIFRLQVEKFEKSVVLNIPKQTDYAYYEVHKCYRSLIFALISKATGNNYGPGNKTLRSVAQGFLDNIKNIKYNLIFQKSLDELKGAGSFQQNQSLTPHDFYGLSYVDKGKANIVINSYQSILDSLLTFTHESYHVLDTYDYSKFKGKKELAHLVREYRANLAEIQSYKALKKVVADFHYGHTTNRKSVASYEKLIKLSDEELSEVLLDRTLENMLPLKINNKYALKGMNKLDEKFESVLDTFLAHQLLIKSIKNNPSGTVNLVYKDVNVDSFGSKIVAKNKLSRELIFKQLKSLTGHTDLKKFAKDYQIKMNLEIPPATPINDYSGGPKGRNHGD